TSFAFILGCVPLWTAAGAGAVGRRILGTVVIGGMLTDTLIASLFISVSFYVSERFRQSPHAAAGPVSVPAPISGGAGDEPSAGGSRPRDPRRPPGSPSRRRCSPAARSARTTSDPPRWTPRRSEGKPP